MSTRRDSAAGAAPTEDGLPRALVARVLVGAVKRARQASEVATTTNARSVASNRLGCQMTRSQGIWIFGFVVTLHVGIAAGVVLGRWLERFRSAEMCAELCRVISDESTPRLEWQQ